MPYSDAPVDEDTLEMGSASWLGETSARTQLLVVTGFAVTRTLLVAFAGLVLTCGLSLVVWAVTPSSGAGATPELHAGVAVFASSNGMTLKIEHSLLTISPLTVTLLVVAMLVVTTGRGPMVAASRLQELYFVLVSSLLYGVVVAVVGSLGAGSAVAGSQWWRPTLLALVVLTLATLVRGRAWRTYIFDRVPRWVPSSFRLGCAGVAMLLGGGGITLIIGLIRTFPAAATVQNLAAPGAAGGFGMALLGVGFLPNAVVAATGFSSGVGFTIGRGTYTPFGSAPTELPAVSLLAAAPDGHLLARSTLLLLIFPLLAAIVVGRSVVQQFAFRTDRLAAAGGAAVVGALSCMVLAVVASGGVRGGAWASSGVPPVPFGLVIGLVFAVVSGLFILVAGTSAVERAAQQGIATEDVAPDVPLPDEPVPDVPVP